MMKSFSRQKNVFRLAQGPIIHVPIARSWFYSHRAPLQKVVAQRRKIFLLCFYGGSNKPKNFLPTTPCYSLQISKERKFCFFGPPAYIGEHGDYKIMTQLLKHEVQGLGPISTYCFCVKMPQIRTSGFLGGGSYPPATCAVFLGGGSG